MKGLVVVGYQGIGKSYIGGIDRCVDLESGSFYVGEERDENWYIPYCQTALQIANQGYTVLTSSHKVVYEFFASAPLPENVGKVVVFCPQVIHKDEWIARLQDRYDRTGLFKDWKALENAKDRFEENIVELVNCGLPAYQPWYVDYNLLLYIRKMRQDWCLHKQD